MTALVKQHERGGDTLAVDGRDGGQNQYLTFTLGGEMYAIGILRIKEIIEYGSVTAVPMMPGFIRGVINLRGAVVPVVDLAARFARGVSPMTRRTCIVIIETESGDERHDIGVMVDSVSEVLQISASDVAPAPDFGAKIRADFIHGMGRVDGRFVIILDVGRVLSLDELALPGNISADGVNSLSNLS